MKSIDIKPFFVLLLSLLMTACGGSSGSNDVATNPTIGARLSLSITNDQNQAITTAEATDAVIVNVTATNDFGRAAAGITVTFSTDLGSLSQSTALTNSSGIASVRLVTTSTQIGVAGVLGAATVDTKSLTSTGQISITEKLTEPTNLNVSLLDESCTIPVTSAQAGVTLCVKASLFTGTTAIEGEVVDFTVSQGTLRPASVLTDASGIATTYIDSTENLLGASTLSATSLSQSASVNYQYTAIPNQIPTVSLALLDESCSNPVTSVQAGITLCVKASIFAGDTPIEGEIVDFAVSQGTLRPASVTTDATGAATTYIDSTETMLGASTISASYLTQSTAINYQYTPVPNQPALSLTLLDESCTNAITEVQAGLTLCVKASLFAGTAAIEGAIVDFTVTQGSLRPASATTDATGIATTYIDSTQAMLGASTINAAYLTQNAAVNYQYTSVPNQTPTVALTLLDETCTNPVTSVQAGLTLCVKASLFTGATAMEGEIIDFSVSQGTLRPASATTDTTGIATAYIDSTEAMLGASTISATYLTQSTAINYQYTAVPNQPSLSLSLLDETCVNPVTSVQAGLSLCVKASLFSGATAIEGEVVNFTVSQGSLRPASATTDNLGIATIYIDSTEAMLGASTLNATYLTQSTALNYQYTAVPTQPTVSLSLLDETCTNPVTSVQAGLTLCVKASLFKGTTAVEGEIVDFAVTQGSLRPASATTDATGIATTYIDSTEAMLGASTITATYLAQSTAANYQYNAVPAVSLTLLDETCTNLITTVQAGSTLCVKASLLSGTTAIEGAIVDFNVTQGSLRPASATTDVTGIATTYIDSTEAMLGASTITATYLGQSTAVNYQYTAVSNQPKVFLTLFDETCTNPVTSVQAGLTLCVKVSLFSNSLPIEGEIVNFTVSQGALRPASATTDATGIATTYIDSTSAMLGASTITATYLTHSTALNYQYTSVPTASLTLLDETCTNPVTSIQAGLTLCVKASLLNGTTPIEGEIVDFTVSQGSLRPASATTDATGIATTYIDSTETMLGASTITATYSNQSTAINYQYTAVPNQSPTVSLSLLDETCTNPVATVEAGLTLCVKASLLAGTTPIEGEIVDFTVTQGSLRPASATTDAAGIATTYIDSAQAMLGASTITATYLTQSAAINYQYTAAPNQPTVFLTLFDETCTNSVTSVQAGLTLCVKASLFSNSIPIEGEIVDFTVSQGSLRPASATTDATGIATTYIDSTEAMLGASTITATYLTQSAAVNYQYTAVPNQPTISLALLDETCTNPATSVQAGLTLCVKASLLTGSTAIEGEIVDFAVSQGSMRPASATTDVNGIATAYIDSTEAMLGASTITATYLTQSAAANYQYTAVPNQPTVFLTLFDETCTNKTATVQAGLSLCVKVSIIVDNTIVVGGIVDFTVSQGSLRPASATTDANGIATAYIDSTEAMLGASTIIATYLTKSATTNYQYSPVPSQSPTISLTLLDNNCATAVNSIEAGGTFCLKAGITQNGQPTPNEVISFASPIGTLRENTVLTDSNGFAITYLDSTSTITGAASATASFGNFSAVQNYQFTALSANNNTNIALSVLDESCTNSLNSVSAGSSLCLQASLIRQNSPVGNAIVTFAAPLGTLRQTTALTNNNGVASVLLDSATTVLGAAIASAGFESVSTTQNYQFTDTPSLQSTLLTLDIRDSGCQALTNSTSAGTALCLILTLTKGGTPQANELISFTAPLGTLSQSSTLTNQDGIATVLLNSTDTQVGAATATASFNEFALGRNYEFTQAIPQQGTTLALVIYDQSCTTPVTVALAGTTLCIKTDLTLGNAGIKDEVVQFSATLGTLNPTSSLTDVNGSASVFLTSTDTQLGAATITATVASKSLSASKNYQLIGSTSNSTLTLTTHNADCIAATNSFASGSTFCLVAKMLNEGTPVANQIITFTSPIGTLRQTTALTNAQGLASVLVDSTSTQLGAAAALADHANLNAVTNYEFVTGGSQTTLGPVLTLATIQNGAFNNRFKAGENVQLQAKLLDSNGQAIQPETVVRYTVERGVLSTDSALTSATTGLAEVVLTAQATDIGAAVATVRADVENVTYTTTFNYEILSPDTVEDEVPSIGYFNDANVFVPNEIKLSITADANGKYNLSAGGTMGLSVVVVNQRNERIITPTPVTFSSACADNNNANLDTLVTTINGQAQSTYEDVSCATVNGNQDVLSASVTINNVTLTATATIELLPEAVGSIEFVSAVPTNIVLRGTGGQGKQETSTLSFLVKGVLGNPLTQQAVTFSLDTLVGDLSISPVNSLTNSQGLVTTKVTAGNVPAAVRVTAATVVGTDPVTNENIVIRTQSDLLSVNTGLPDQNSITLATAVINPEANAFTGVEVILTAFMADSFNNPVPDGTTVNFTTEGGFIQPTCNTVNGSCTVIWTGSNPRVPNHRITVLATAIGHETFFDFNGNNVFDDADGVALTQNTDSGLNRGVYELSGFVDHSEAWRDDDEDRVHDGGELFIDYNNDKTFNPADGLFNGPHCLHATLCGSQAASKINVRKAIVMIMSGSNPIFTLMTNNLTSTNNTAIGHVGSAYVLSTNDTETGVTIDGGVSIDGNGVTTANATSNIILEEGQSLAMILTMADDAVGLGQILPAGTNVNVSTSFGGVSGTNSFSIPNSVGYLNSTGVDQYGGTNIEFSLVNNNSTSNGGDPTQSGQVTFTFTLPSSNSSISYSVPFTMIGR